MLTPPDASANAVFATGTSVGELACKLYKNGKRIEFDPSNFTAMIEQTAKLIKDGESTIYEATFSYNGLLVMIDILSISNSKFTINEVKSSTQIKDVYVNDASIQYFVLRSLGYEVECVNVVHINNEYVRGDELELDKLFCSQDITELVLEKQAQIPKTLAHFEAILNESDEPDIDIGTHCSDPYGCDAWEYCWQGQRQIPKYSIFNISRLRSDKKFDLYKRNIVKFSDITDLSEFNATQQKQIKAELSGEEFIDKSAIKAFLDTLSYPVYHLDFETFSQAVPEFAGLRAYEQIPFQFSVHKDYGDGRTEHFEFLAKTGVDPRRELTLVLIDTVPQNSCVLAYNMGFEKGVIRKLAENFSDLKEPLLNIHDNICDLMTPFANKDYYSPKMQGSYSIKYVLPALVSEFEKAYESLSLVHHGGEAMEAFAKMAYMSQDEQKAYREALLRYCELDTLAMVEILRKLREIVG